MATPAAPRVRGFAPARGTLLVPSGTVMPSPRHQRVEQPPRLDQRLAQFLRTGRCGRGRVGRAVDPPVAMDLVCVVHGPDQRLNSFSATRGCRLTAKSPATSWTG